MFKLYMCLTGSTLVILFPMDSPALRPQLCSRRCGRHPSRRMRSCPLKRELRACRSPRRPTSTRASCLRPVEQENNQSSTNQAAGRPPTPSSDCRGHVRKGGRGGGHLVGRSGSPRSLLVLVLVVGKVVVGLHVDPILVYAVVLWICDNTD